MMCQMEIALRIPSVMEIPSLAHIVWRMSAISVVTYTLNRTHPGIIFPFLMSIIPALMYVSRDSESTLVDYLLSAVYHPLVGVSFTPTQGWGETLVCSKRERATQGDEMAKVSPAALLDLLDAAAEPGQESDKTEPRRHVLRMPWEERYAATSFGGWYADDLKMWVIDALTLPPALVPYASQPYSWERWVEEDINAGFAVTPPALPLDPSPQITLRPHQEEGVDAIVRAHQSGGAGFLLADDVGLGKTYAAGAGALAVGAKKILVLCPLSVVPAWRLSIPVLDPSGAARWCVINYDRAKSLLEVPPSAAAAKRARTKNKHTASKGKSLVEWDLVIKDEAHLLSNPVSQRSAAVRRLDGEGTKRRAFSLWLSATAGRDPLALSYLSPVLVGGGGERPELEEFEEWCTQQGISVTRGAYGRWEWERNEADLRRMHSLLFQGSPPIAIRRRPTDIAGWPEQQRVLLPIELDAQAMGLYNEAWGEFREQMKLVPRGSDSTNPMVRALRFRQKSSLLRVPGMVEATKTALSNGFQVGVSVEFRESIEQFVEGMGAEEVAVIHGGVTGPAREEERRRFQRGEARVVAFSVTTGISLHAGESAIGGNSVPRTMLIDPRWSSMDALQTEGRCHRDGKYSLASYCYAEGTIDKRILEVVLGRMSDTKMMQGDDTTTLNKIEALLLNPLPATPPSGTTR